MAGPPPARNTAAPGSDPGAGALPRPAATDKSRNLLLHMRPRQVPAAALRFTHTLGLGGIATVLAMLLIASGLTMMFVYEPTPGRAHASVVAMERAVLFGALVRGVHYWSANLLIGVTLAHLLRVFFTGGFLGSRRVNWLIGIALLLVVLVSAFTGYLLPWDQMSYWAVTISSEMLDQVPGLGPGLQQLVLGGTAVGAPTMTRFYAMHTTVVPVLIVLFSFWHFWRVRAAGGVVPPRRAVSDVEDLRPFNPDLLLREVVVALITAAAVLLLAVYAGAPLGEVANPGLSPNPAKAPWYFLGFQELLLHLHPLFAVLVVPLLLLAGLAALPWLVTDENGYPGPGQSLAAAVTGGAGATAWVLADEWLAGPGGWVEGASPLVANGLVPFATLLAVIIALYLLVRKGFNASKDMAVQALFILFFAGLLALTAIGIWFRGPGMALTWPGTI